MTTSTPRTVTFETTLAGSGGKTGILVPKHAIDELAAGQRPPVLVDLNGYQYRSTVAVMSSQYMVGVSAEVRTATGLAAGDPLRVTLTGNDASTRPSRCSKAGRSARAARHGVSRHSRVWRSPPTRGSLELDRTQQRWSVHQPRDPRGRSRSDQQRRSS